jgi:hypothetical protein
VESCSKVCTESAIAQRCAACHHSGVIASLRHPAAPLHCRHGCWMPEFQLVNFGHLLGAKCCSTLPK